MADEFDKTIEELRRIAKKDQEAGGREVQHKLMLVIGDLFLVCLVIILALALYFSL